ncbi:thioesterase II family protein [Rhizobium rhizogenes]|uniref:thioesterase II family protein n=1 Tax=Rhizobium rhizogenes TaxID=359 RepID=UPI001F3DCFD4|nr:alpha/beta fold hydrolase [Rhizobium rhizogenes]WEO70091.1 alpha/beta fold hydrolase [Rhizobium rhizogenes]
MSLATVSSHVTHFPPRFRYVRALRTTKARLFCLHPAGGSSASFRHWATLPEDGIEVWPIHLPGHGVWQDEPLICDMTELVDLLLKGMIPFLGEFPFVLYGHSMGALVAFELARNLEIRALKKPSALIISGCLPPIPLLRYFQALSEESLLREVLAAGGFPNEIAADDELFEFFSHILLNDLRLLRRYRWDPFSKQIGIPLSIHLGSADPICPPSRGTEWADYTSAETSYTIFPGGHFFLETDTEAVQKAIATTIKSQLCSDC